jgi:hypothetical protein
MVIWKSQMIWMSWEGSRDNTWGKHGCFLPAHRPTPLCLPLSPPLAGGVLST